MFKMDSFLENKDFYKKKKKLYATRYIFQLFLHIYIYTKLYMYQVPFFIVLFQFLILHISHNKLQQPITTQLLNSPYKIYPQ